jgi:hypothetical protein
MRQRLEGVVLQPGTPDKMLSKWSESGSFSTASAYRTMFIGHASIPGVKELWKVKCCFFAWLLLLDRCWTLERLHRHDLQNNGPCALCSQCDEHIDHLVLSCAFSRQVWFNFLRRCNWHQHLAPSASDTFVLWWLSAREDGDQGQEESLRQHCHPDGLGYLAREKRQGLPQCKCVSSGRSRYALRGL